MATKLVAPGAIGLMVLGAALFAAAQEPRRIDTEVTLTGCIEAEQDYRTRVDGGSGPGVTATDTVLTGATGAAAEGTTPSAELVAILSAPADYALTGKLETQFGTAGVRVQIAGFLEDVTAGHASNGTTILPRLYIKAWQPGVGSCAP